MDAPALDNAEIAAMFRDIAALLRLKKDSIFKIRAYEKVARSIDEMKEPVSALAAEDRLREIPGAGDAIVKKLREFYVTGHVAYYERLLAEFPERDSGTTASAEE